MKPVAIELAVVNAAGRVQPEGVYTFIEAAAEDIETYILAPPPPGVIRAAAVDFVLILGVAGSIASLASILWLAYDKLIAPQKPRNGNAGLVLMLRGDDGSLNSLWIGNQYRDRDLFIQKFTAKVEAARNAGSNGASTERVVNQVKFSGHWVRRV